MTFTEQQELRERVCVRCAQPFWITWRLSSRGGPLYCPGCGTPSCLSKEDELRRTIAGLRGALASAKRRAKKGAK